MEFGFPLSEIPELEISDFNDWLAAAQAKKINDELALMNIAVFAQPAGKREIRERQNIFNKKKSEQLVLFGDDPFKVDEGLIKRSKEKLRSIKLLKKNKK